MKGKKNRSQESQRQVTAEKVKDPENQKTVQDMKNQIGPMKSPGIEAKKRIIQGIGKESQRDVIIRYFRRVEEYFFQVLESQPFDLRVFQNVKRIIPVVKIETENRAINQHGNQNESEEIEKDGPSRAAFLLFVPPAGISPF